MISKSTIQLLKDISNTESPSAKKYIIMHFCILEGKENDPIDLIDLINTCQLSIDKKKEQGSMARSNIKIKQTGNSKKGKIYKHPKFFLVFNGHGSCNSCHSAIEKGSPAFFHKTGEYTALYCPTPSCFPETHKDNMMSDKDFINWTKPR